MWSWAYNHPWLFWSLALFGEYLVIVKGQEVLLEILKAIRWR